MNTQNTTPLQLLRKHFPGTSPLQLDEGECKSTAQMLQQRLAGLNYIKVRDTFYVPFKEQVNLLCSLRIDLPNESLWSNFTGTLKRNEAGELTLLYDEHKFMVSSLDEVIAFARDCQERAEPYHMLRQKAEKIRTLQTQNILAQVKKLAEEEQFAYYLRTDGDKLRLYIKLAKVKYVELAIPFRKFQEAAPMIRSAIRQLHQLYKTGIRFRMGERLPFDRYDKDGWIQPEPITTQPEEKS